MTVPVVLIVTVCALGKIYAFPILVPSANDVSVTVYVPYLSTISFIIPCEALSGFAAVLTYWSTVSPFNAVPWILNLKSVAPSSAIFTIVNLPVFNGFSNAVNVKTCPLF